MLSAGVPGETSFSPILLLVFDKTNQGFSVSQLSGAAA